MRKNKQGGFTLIEMLVVVAIIAILIAVSIPVVNNALERARESTDAANERAFKAEVIVAYLTGTPDDAVYQKIVKTGAGNVLEPGRVYYDAAAGKVQAEKTPVITGYGKGTKVIGYKPYPGISTYGDGDVSGKILGGSYNVETGEFTCSWENPN